jgi:hypothetical protein
MRRPRKSFLLDELDGRLTVTALTFSALTCLCYRYVRCYCAYRTCSKHRYRYSSSLLSAARQTETPYKRYQGHGETTPIQKS